MIHCRKKELYSGDITPVLSLPFLASCGTSEGFSEKPGEHLNLSFSLEPDLHSKEGRQVMAESKNSPVSWKVQIHPPVL